MDRAQRSAGFRSLTLLGASQVSCVQQKQRRKKSLGTAKVCACKFKDKQRIKAERHHERSMNEGRVANTKSENEIEKPRKIRPLSGLTGVQRFLLICPQGPTNSKEETLAQT